MRSLLKVWLPPFVGFAAYFVAIRYSSVYFTLRIDQMGEGTITAFMAYYRYFLPLLFIVAILTQYLLVVPVWDMVFLKSRVAKIASTLILVVICALFAGGVSYTIWDRASGVGHLQMVYLFMASVQLVYWFVNLGVLYFLTKKPEQPDENTETAE